VYGEAELLEIIGALSAPRCLAGRLHGRQEQGDENCDDGNDNQKLDEREPVETKTFLRRDLHVELLTLKGKLKYDQKIKRELDIASDARSLERERLELIGLGPDGDGQA
jgi:hypothetical protein